MAFRANLIKLNFIDQIAMAPFLYANLRHLPGEIMDTHRRFVAHLHFPGPARDSLPKRPLAVQAITAGSSAPAVYHATGLTRSTWKRLCIDVFSTGTIDVKGSPPRLATRHAVLIFGAEKPHPPLCLAGRVTDRGGNGFSLHIDHPGLSWRVAAADFGRRLSSQPEASVSSKHRMRHATEISILKKRRLRLRPDLGGSASTIAPTAELADVVTALRAGFYDLDELLRETEACPASTLSYLTALDSADIIVDAPRPGHCTGEPFSALALHWSAYTELVERNYRGLRAHADGEYAHKLSLAHALLCKGRERRRIRHTFVPAPVIGEVTHYLRNLLERAICTHRTERTIDLCRRVLELDPSDHHVREVLEASVS